MMVANEVRETEGTLMDPKRFNMWLAIAGSVMLFAGLTSAYIVKRAEGNWNAFPIPDQFIFSTILAVLSSISMQLAFWSAKKDEINRMNVALLSTLILGIAFGVSQILGWNELVKRDLHVFFTDDVAVSFFYIITALHFLHVFGGLIALIRVQYKAIKLDVHKKSLRAISMCTTYWHFMGVLWIYLYLFLFLNR